MKSAVLLRIQACWDVTMSPDEWFTTFQKKCIAYVFKCQTIQELQTGLHDPDDEDTMFLQNVGNHSPKDAA